ncbi:group III truncated hemoglobin [Pseudobacter ginsenosidimutans]|jgi:hemoglobin|uniref:Hemoglobin n=1 Tax=Pseudobacter ginsenosidimutans TaxID=661488 RepID=A0A4Q7MUY0_9BACT|nr:group III truncated hemoglobin [Pseudobacter ginsenosidimutans]QEC40571.1 group III truncated hemoglobin [Pseudobacter ginsenosidimutans]RZS72715.1 hemoglobin [Pseudobacter ginsenosidimutans]
MTKQEITDHNSIVLLVDSFYAKARKDDLIGPIFNEVIGDHWDEHLPTMYKFWGDILLNRNEYEGNPMFVHKRLNARIPLQPVHFERWKKLFVETVRELFEGDKAELAEQRAVSIATVMQLKISGYH